MARLLASFVKDGRMSETPANARPDAGELGELVSKTMSAEEIKMVIERVLLKHEVEELLYKLILENKDTTNIKQQAKRGEIFRFGK